MPCGSISKPIRLVYRLEKVFDTQVKGIGYLMKPQERRLYTMVYELPDLLLRHT